MERRKPKNTSSTSKKLWRYLKKSKISLFFAIFFVFINCVSNIGGSYLLRPIINNYIIPGDIQGMLRGMTALLFIYIAEVSSQYIQSRLMVDVAQRTVNTLRKDLFSKMQDLPLRFFDTKNHGEIMSRFTNDMDNISESLNFSLTQIFSSIIIVVGIITIMLIINPLMTLITVVIIPLMTVLARYILHNSRKYFSAQQAVMGEINGYAEEIITGQKVVKVFSFERNVEEEFERLNTKLQEKATKAQFYSALMIPIMVNINTINYALTACIGGILAIRGSLDIGGLMVFLQYSRMLGRPINEMTNQINAIQSALAGAERIFEIMETKPEKEDESDSMELKNIKGDVRFNNVTFGYNPDKIVLKNISIYAKPGQKIALVGSTGAGKTTITNLLTRFYDIDEGSITIDGIDIRKIKKENLRKSLAMVLQDTHLFTGTIIDNIRYGKLEATDEEVIKAAKLAGADSFIRRLSNGYNTVIDGDGNNLSQGQRQLLNIARAAVADPPILILDEATSSIDTRTEKYIEEGMDRLMEGRTNFIIAHRLSTVRNADAIMVIENGEIIERGNHEELLKQRGRYYDLCTGAFELE
ncbi:ABC transporter ATP-binding protein [Sporanaerobacter sp. PP17-6a]|uniref:ABC transporter ATP-binding protein n=1 Tax=Sporanaerobacter sp. PP17-6a TaxID=1891289 RepID=UPI0008A07CE5|nr:ABC transporter ATP-binding protein [Sporanaerobacter sp. PP17-6a]MBE6083043.1 ABC transporter ATP-binding protein [Tissierellaceae bacterium]SCL96713.1 putative ABC transporter ATP-binding protein [Sporanaerobacter sp. PP17-6a]